MIHSLKIDFKKIIVTFILTSVLVDAFIFVSGTTVPYAFTVLFGISGLAQAKEKLLFTIFVMLIQYFSSEIILYHIHSCDYLLIRYSTKRKYFDSVIKEILKSAIEFWLISLISLNFISVIHQHEILFVDIRSFIDSLFFCFCVCIIQTLLLLRYKADVAVCIILSGSVVYALLSQFLFSRFMLSENMRIILQCVGSVVLFIIMYLYLRKKFMEEWQLYAN